MSKLADLAPYVWAVGSHARGTATPQSDIDLTPTFRRNYNPDAERGNPERHERHIPEIIDVLQHHAASWHSPTIGYIVIGADGTTVEVCEWMDALDDVDDTPDPQHLSERR